MSHESTRKDGIALFLLKSRGLKKVMTALVVWTPLSGVAPDGLDILRAAMSHWAALTKGYLASLGSLY